MEADRDNTNQFSDLKITLDELRSLDINRLVPRDGPLNSHRFMALLDEPHSIAKNIGDLRRADALRVLYLICTFHFKPEDRGEPFGPIGRFGHGRTCIPSDLSAETLEALDQHAAEVENPALRARLADIVWLMNPKNHKSAILAIESYATTVKEILKRNSELNDEDIEEKLWRAPDFIRRSFDLGQRTGRNRAEITKSKALLQQLRAVALSTGNEALYRRSAELDLQHEVSDPSLIAQEAERLAVLREGESNFPSAQSSWKLSEQAFRQAKNTEAAARVMIALAECYYKESRPQTASTFMKTHGLTRAIQALRQVQRKYRSPGRLEALQAELVAAQASLSDEMGTFEYTQDLSELIENVKSTFQGKSLPHCIEALARIDLHKPHSHYLEEARKTAEEFPLSSIFGTSVHDDEGKVIVNTEASLGFGTSNDESLMVSVARSMSFEYGLVVSGGIEPARFIISQQYHLSEQVFLALCQQSPFVPVGHEHIYALGLARFFAGAHMEAASLLIPQLENSLRYVMKQIGKDVSVLFSDMTQENAGISFLLGKLRIDLEKVFGEEIIFKVDMLFHSRFGPNLRNRLAHGTMSAGHFWTAEVIYASWLIFQFVCAPLLNDWDEVAKIVFPS